MAARTPLVLIGGQVQRLPAGDVLAGVGLALERETLTNADLTAARNTHLLLTVSGLTANQKLILPVGQSDGDLIAWTLLTASPADYALILEGASGAPVSLRENDFSDESEVTRYLLPREGGLALWDDTAGRWLIDARGDGRIRTRGRIRTDGSTTQDTGESAGTWTPVGNLNTASSPIIGMIHTAGSPTTPTASTLTARRAGQYRIAGSWQPTNNVGDGDSANPIGYNYTQSLGYGSHQPISGGAGRSILPIGADLVDLSAGDAVGLRFRSDTGGVGVSQYGVNNVSLQEVF